MQIATGILNSRASSVIIATDPYGAIRSPGEFPSQNNRSFVEVPACAVGFVMVTQLPEAEKEDSHLASAIEFKKKIFRIAHIEANLKTSRNGVQSTA